MLKIIKQNCLKLTKEGLVISKLKLSSISKPWESHLNLSKLKKYSNDIHLTEIDEIPFNKDIALINKQGKPSGWIPTSLLIENILREWKKDRAFYETILLTIDNAITIVNQDGVIEGWNHRSEEIYGHTTDDVLNKNIREFFEEKTLMMQVLETEEKAQKHYYQPLPDVHVLINALPVYCDNKRIGVISVDRDITDLVKINEELSNTTAYVRNLEKKLEREMISKPLSKIKGKSPAIKKTLELTEKIAKTDATVLITGESGVGKELFAEAIHKAGNRSNFPFIAVNCGAIPLSLFESELFGYEKGAFTGAITSGKKGKIDAAKDGTLFLDEIGEIPLELQAKLLRVLQEKEFYRIGGTKPIPVKARIIAATNKDLRQMIEKKQFREDLYYRLNVVSLTIPPLRERKEDIIEFVELFLNEFSAQFKISAPDIDKKVMQTFLQYSWPGNIRELRNVIQRIVILGLEDGINTLEYLQEEIFQLDITQNQPLVTTTQNLNKKSGGEKEEIKNALTITYGNKSAAAKLLGVSRGTFYNKLKKYNLRD